MDPFTFGIFIYIVFIISAVFHEYAHGWMAYRLGDPTAKNLGRLTLNPLAHIDIMGSVLLPLFLVLVQSPFVVGWAKPVPYNPYNLRDPKYGNLKVAAAGPAVNIIIAALLGIVVRLHFAGVAFFGGLSQELMFLIGWIVFINIILAVFNLIPFPPLDGSKIFSDLFPNAWRGVMRLGFLGIFIALFIAFTFLGPVAIFFFELLTGAGFGVLM